MNRLFAPDFRIFIILLVVFSSSLNGQSTSDITITPFRPTNKCPNGGFDLSVNGGIGPFSVLWEWEFTPDSYRLIRQQDGVPGNNGLEDIDGLPPGDYRVTLTDAACGQYIQELELLQGLFDTGGRRIVVSKGNVKTCGKEGTNDGYIELEFVMGLAEPYDIVWNGPGVNNVMGRSIMNLQDGIYTVTITTPDGCELIKKITICCCEVETIDDPKNLEKSEKDPIACSNRDLVFPITIYQDLLYSPDNRNSYNGQIQIRISGGTSENTILWTGPDGFTSDRTNIGNLGVGEYCVTVQDGCSEDSRCYELVDCSERPIQLFAAPSNSCLSLNGSDIYAGVIQLQVQGGWPPFEYRWDDGVTSRDRESLPAGTYCVTVNDSKGCRPESACFTLNYNSLVPVAASGNRCGQAWFCNGQEYEPDFQPYSTYWDFDDPDCRIQHEYCTFETPNRRMPSAPRVNDFLATGFIEGSCDYWGQCPDPARQDRLQRAAEGELVDKWFVTAVSCNQCDGGFSLQCNTRQFCQATFEGVLRERFIQILARPDVAVGSTEFPILCPSGCAFTCNGEDAIDPNSNSDIAQCGPCDIKEDKANFNPDELIITDLTIADHILSDLNAGIDLKEKYYYFPGKVTLGTLLKDLPEWSEDINNQTEFKNITHQDLLPFITGNVPDNHAYITLSERMNEEFAEQISIQPNPVLRDISIILSDELKASEKDLTLQIFDLNGKLIARHLITDLHAIPTINVEQFPEGMYILKFVGPFSGFVTKKLIKR